ncbi:MAG: hypothetical protein SGPRY_013994 [Prymnesium sp.]
MASASPLRSLARLLSLLVAPSIAPPVPTASEADCRGWALEDECEYNPKFMMSQCRAVCVEHQTVLRAYMNRCPRPVDQKSALMPGAMRHTFARVMRDFAHLQPEMLSADPPVVLFNSFLSNDEVSAFLRQGAGHYERSRALEVDKRGQLSEVMSSYRTSSHMWCQSDECVNDPIVKRVSERVANVTQTPLENMEFMQLLYYHACESAKID